MPQSYSPQIYTHLEAAGCRWSSAASFVLSLFEVIFLLSSESETLVSNDFKILALFLQVVSAFNFEHLQTEKNRERLGALLKKLYFYPQNVS